MTALQEGTSISFSRKIELYQGCALRKARRSGYAFGAKTNISWSPKGERKSPGPPGSSQVLLKVSLAVLYIGVSFFQNAGEESVSNLDKIRYANGGMPTADLRLNMQKVQ